MTPIGQLLDSLGVGAELDEGDLPTSAVVILSVLEPDDSIPRLVVASSEGLSWIEQAGLVRLAERITSDIPQADED